MPPRLQSRGKMGECAGVVWQGGRGSSRVGVLDETMRKGWHFRAEPRVGSEK